MSLLYNIISVLAVIFFVGSIQFKKKKDILLIQTVASVFYMTAYFMVGAYSGAITEIIEQIKDIVFYFYEKNEKKIPFMLLIIFVLGLIVIAIFTYNGFNTLVPLFINFAYFVSSYFKNPKYIRIVMLICGFMWIYYNISVGLPIIIIGNCFEIVSAIVSLVRFRENN